MAETKKIAIFELAPELGLKPLDLVKQISSSKIKLSSEIKNHMSEVSAADAEKIREYLLNKDKAPQEVEKKTTVKKKSAVGVKATKEKEVVEKKPVSKVAKKKKEEPKQEEPKEEQKQHSKTIVRKKKIEEPV
ncbi:MAG TPA: translation initiation factor IF-2 N-terminal domain-containing protein, partial [bacterium]|nr:translation initiation factor IF-2 N-terminal domain-containing protein [bacterium]